MWFLPRKLRERCDTSGDVLSLLAVRGQALWSELWGTAALRCKAALFGVECRRGVRAAGWVILARGPKSRIVIGDGVSLISCPRRATAATLMPVRLKTIEPTAEIVLEQGVQLNGTSVTARSKRIYIGAHTMIAPGCVLTDSDFHALLPAETRAFEPGYERDAGIELGEYVWIGMDCLILKGVHIGRGSVVAAGSVVTRSLPGNCLAAGVPAKPVRMLDTPADGQIL